MKITPESLQAGVTPEELAEQNEQTKTKKYKKEKKPKKERHLFGKGKSADDIEQEDNNTQDYETTHVDDERDDEQSGFIDDEQNQNDVVTKPKSYVKTTIIASCIVVLLAIAGIGTYAFVSSMSIDNTQAPANKTLSKEEQALLDSDSFDKDNEKRTGDKDIEVDTPADSMSDAERIVKLQSEIDRLKSELEKAQNATTKDTPTKTETPAKEIPSTTQPISESETVKDLRKQIGDLQSSLSASQARESYLQNQLNAAKTNNSK